MPKNGGWNFNDCALQSPSQRTYAMSDLHQHSTCKYVNIKKKIMMLVEINHMPLASNQCVFVTCICTCYSDSIQSLPPWKISAITWTSCLHIWTGSSNSWASCPAFNPNIYTSMSNVNAWTQLNRLRKKNLICDDFEVFIVLFLIIVCCSNQLTEIHLTWAENPHVCWR